MYRIGQKIKSFFNSSIKTDILVLSITLICLILSFLGIKVYSIDPAWIVIIFCGCPIIYSATRGLVKYFDIKADVLVAVALIASVYIKEYFAAAEVAFIMQLGSFLKGLTVAKAREGIEKLVTLAPRTAHLIRDNQTTTISCEQIQINDIIRVLPGEIIPVDGIILRGKTSIDESLLTGESLLVDKLEGDSVRAGCFNKYASFDLVATKTCEDSTIQRMVKLLKSTSPNKARIVGFADLCATWIVLAAVSISIITWMVTADTVRAVTVLVVFCPCAFVLATPTAIIAAIGNLTRKGFLVQQGDALEKLAHVTTVTFDKTGTLTYGNCKVTGVVTTDDKDSDLIYKYVATLETQSHHPLARSIVTSFLEKYPDTKLEQVDNFKSYFGKGVEGNINSCHIIVGNKTLLEEFNIKLSDVLHEKETKLEDNGSTLIHIALDNKHIGFLTISDTIRDESPAIIKFLTKNNIKTVLLTGDNHRVANHVANQLNISEVYAETLPEQKLEIIKTLSSTKTPVCMVGDGINDALALKQADVSVAVSSVGNEILLDISDIVVVGDHFKHLDFLFILAKKMLTTIKLNMLFSFGINTLAISCAVMGALGPVGGALVHNGGSFLVVLNSALLLKNKFTH